MTARVEVHQQPACLLCEGAGRVLLRQVGPREDGVHVPWGGVELRCGHGLGSWRVDTPAGAR